MVFSANCLPIQLTEKLHRTCVHMLKEVRNWPTTNMIVMTVAYYLRNKMRHNSKAPHNSVQLQMPVIK